MFIIRMNREIKKILIFIPTVKVLCSANIDTKRRKLREQIRLDTPEK